MTHRRHLVAVMLLMGALTGQAADQTRSAPVAPRAAPGAVPAQPSPGPVAPRAAPGAIPTQALKCTVSLYTASSQWGGGAKAIQYNVTNSTNKGLRAGRRIQWSSSSTGGGEHVLQNALAPGQSVLVLSSPVIGNPYGDPKSFPQCTAKLLP